MDKFQLLICDVQLAGDIRNVVHRGIDSPVTYPERIVLEFIHGKEAIHNVRAIGEIERDAEAEFNRLCRLYQRDLIRQIFPGALMQLPTHDRKAIDFDRAPRGVVDTPEAKAGARKIAQRQAQRANNESEPDLEDADPFADADPVARRKSKSKADLPKPSRPQAELDSRV